MKDETRRGVDVDRRALIAGSALAAGAAAFGAPAPALAQGRSTAVPGAVRRIMPDRALPAPISQASVTPFAAIQATDSRQRTEPVT